MNPHLLLAAAEGIGQGLVPALLDPSSDPARLLADPPPGVPRAVRARCADRARLAAIATRWLRDAERIGARVITADETTVLPEQLQRAPLRPLVLFAIGDVDLLRRAGEALAIVGSRTPTAYGRAAARDFATRLAQAGVVLWSGLAAGIDAIAHEACLEAGVPTVAVVAGGFESVYPAAHRGLFDRIASAEGRGLCLAEAPPAMLAQRGHFPRRNRILALATRATLVIEAGHASGSLHTARFAADAGRDVFAVPGPYTSERSRGCHRLIAEGAGIASDPSFLLRELGVASGGVDDIDSPLRATRSMNASADQAAILSCLEAGPRPADLVGRESRLDRDEFLDALYLLLEQGTVLELEGGLLALGPGRDRAAPANPTTERTPTAGLP